jgi:sigma-B regulation protein RsbQ
MTKSQKKLNAQILGKGEKTMLFVHGYGCDQNMWRFITPAFETSYKIVLIDLVGSGQSDLNAYDFDKYNTLQAHADDILDLIDELDLNNIVFVGHSVSAMIGALVSIKKPTAFDCIIMIGPSPRYISDDYYDGGFSKESIDELVEALDSNYLGWSSAITPVIMGNPERPALAQELKNSFCRNNPAIAKHFAHVTFLGDNRADLEKVTVPTLILQCSSDVIAPLHVGTYVHQHIKDSQLTLLKAKGHCPHLSEPEETIQSMKKFLSAR